MIKYVCLQILRIMFAAEDYVLYILVCNFHNYLLAFIHINETYRKKVLYYFLKYMLKLKVELIVFCQFLQIVITLEKLHNCMQLNICIRINTQVQAGGPYKQGNMSPLMLAYYLV